MKEGGDMKRPRDGTLKLPSVHDQERGSSLGFDLTTRKIHFATSLHEYGTRSILFVPH